jgi:hypothetical protein
MLDDPQHDLSRIRKSLRAMKIAVVVLPLFLIYGLWDTRGGLLYPRLAGASVNIFLTGCCLWAIRKGQKVLREKDQSGKP